MMRILQCLFLSIALSPCSARAAAEPLSAPGHITDSKPSRCSLLVVEFPPGKHVADPEVLIRYDLADGVLEHREEILTTPNNVVRYDLDPNQLYANRYVITRWGDVVDIKKRAVIHKSNGEVFIAREHSLLILYRSNDQKFYCFDLGLQRHWKLEHPGKWALLHKELSGVAPVLSPDGTKSIMDGSVQYGALGTSVFTGDALTLCTLDGAMQVLGKGFRFNHSVSSSIIVGVPRLWLDNERVLTQRDNGKLVILRMDGSVEPVVSIEIPKSPVSPPELFRDPEGRIIYTCSGESYVVDVEKKTFAQREWQSLEFGFEAGLAKPANTLNLIRYRGEEIGRGDFDIRSARTAEGRLAIAPERTPASPKEVHVWNDATKKWNILKLPASLIDVIGWVERDE